MDDSDHDLLRRYAEERSQGAFAEIVRRHVDLVYSTAHRQVQSSALAEEIAQSVFLDLARNAARIQRSVPVVAWLHLVTRRTAIDTIRQEVRRHRREQTAMEISTMNPSPSVWKEMEPLLDEALGQLGESDRAAILLRFFENKSLREVGAMLGTSDDTAQKRVSRAVDLLRDFFLRRGVAVSSATLATDLSAHALQTAPAGLGATISATAGVIAETLKVISMTALQKSVLAAAIALSFGGAAFEFSLLRTQRLEAATLRQRSDDTAAEIRRATAQRDFAQRGILEAQQRFTTQPPPKTPGEVALEAEMSAWLERVERLRRMRDQRPDLVTPEVRMISEDALFAAARELRLDTEEEIRTTFAQLRSSSESTLVSRIQKALQRYLAAHAETLPETSGELASFFDPPIDPSALSRYVMKQSGKVADFPRNALVITQHSPLDFSRDSLWDIQLNGYGSKSALGDVAGKAIKAFRAANQGARPTQPEQLQPYLPSPVDPTKLQPFLAAPRR